MLFHHADSGETCLIQIYRWISFALHQATKQQIDCVPPPKLNSKRPWKDTETQKERIVFQLPFFRGYVKLQGCIAFLDPKKASLKSHRKHPHLKSWKPIETHQSVNLPGIVWNLAIQMRLLGTFQSGAKKKWFSLGIGWFWCISWGRLSRFKLSFYIKDNSNRIFRKDGTSETPEISFGDCPASRLPWIVNINFHGFPGFTGSRWPVVAV